MATIIITVFNWLFWKASLNSIDLHLVLNNQNYSSNGWYSTGWLQTEGFAQINNV